MIVINCSAAAVAHLRMSDNNFFENLSSVEETIPDRQEKLGSEKVFQWVVHAVKIGRSTCLIALDFNTRWAHVIHQVRKGNVADFIERLNSRLINGIEWLGSDYSLFNTGQMEKAIERYFSLHREIRFYQQSDRSAIAHINQVSGYYQDAYRDFGAFPQDENAALEFDLRVNRDWRCPKGESFDLQVDEKMLLYWMTYYSGTDGRNADEIVSQIRQVKYAF